ncbi:MAG: hypothetical protein Q9M19_05645 [Mariprofundaceae bacterium]|nr:hypothetical protein [Mariprofundaceae bacterium]
MNLPTKERTFYFDHKDEYGERREGNFTVKCRLTMRERQVMELYKSRIVGGHTAPTDALTGISVMVATLNTHITEAPEWWKQSDSGLDLEDETIVVDLFNQLTTEQLAWRDELTQYAIDKTKAAKEALDGETSSGNGPVETK